VSEQKWNNNLWRIKMNVKIMSLKMTFKTVYGGIFRILIVLKY